jgi:hypothetical protein
MGKGSRQRPANKNKFDVNFEKIFGDKNNVQCQTGNQANKALRRVQLKTLINQVRALYAITLKSVDRFNTYLTSSTRLKG